MEGEIRKWLKTQQLMRYKGKGWGKKPHKNVKDASLKHGDTKSRNSEGQEKWHRSDRLTAKP